MVATDEHSSLFGQFVSYEEKNDSKGSWGLYYKTLQICNIRQMDSFCSEQVFYNIEPRGQS